MNYYQHHIGDFRAGTVHMSRTERWIYRDLIDVYYDTEQPLPLDLDELCRAIGVRTDDERTVVIDLLKFKFQKTDVGYAHKRCDAEIDSYKAKAATARSNGKLNGKTAKATPSTAEPSGYQAGTHSVPIPSPGQTGLVTNQEPETKNHEPVTTVSPPSGGDVASDAGDQPLVSKAKPNCPHQEIIDLYHSILPMCPLVREWTPARAAQLRARWNEDEKRQNMDYWRRFFEYVAECDFLVGKAGSKPFYADLEWMTKIANFTKIREEKYANR